MERVADIIQQARGRIVNGRQHFRCGSPSFVTEILSEFGSEDRLRKEARKLQNSQLGARNHYKSMQFYWRTMLLSGLCAILAVAVLESVVEGSTIAILEYRAGVKAAPDIASGMAQELSQLTSHKVIGPTEASLSLGTSADAEVAQCQGNPICVAHVGKKLKCDEVILVGISQLGDLILAMQRIEVSSHRVLTQLADSLQPNREILSADLQRYLHRLLPASDFKRYGNILIHTEKKADEVFIDDAYQGKTPLPPIKVLAPKRYGVRVSRSGHADFFARLDVLPDTTVEVTPVLTPEGRGGSWYKQWWVWTLIGGAVAATATIAIVAGGSHGEGRVPAIIRVNP